MEDHSSTSLELDANSNTSGEPERKKDGETASKNNERESGSEQTDTNHRAKLSKVDWRSVLIVIAVIMDYFLIYSSISLLGAFFSTKART